MRERLSHNRVIRALFTVVLVLCVAGCWHRTPSGPVPKTSPPKRDSGSQLEISLDALQGAGGGLFRVTGFSRAELARLAEAKLGAEAWQKVFDIHVARQDAEDQPPVLGEHRVDQDAVVFEPRFPIQPGIAYKAVFDPTRLPAGLASEQAAIEKTFFLPEPSPGPPTVVRQVYPSGDVLPENLLKFYVHFSAPMSRGEAYERVRLLKADGEEVELPFLGLNEELWDGSGTRLTLFFDPGRIKRGLKPREEVGPVLEEGKSYTLVIDAAWRDAEGQPLKQAYRKEFKSAAPDDTQPNPKNWQPQPPAAKTTEPLTIRFDEPLDEGMLGGVLAVVDASNKPVAGRIEIDQQETRWRFHPQGPWQAGRYTLLVDTTLEDLAGNSIGRPFEVDAEDKMTRRIKLQTVSLPFDVLPISRD